jgi:cytochrome oxidase assembly protein ShyY1
VRTAGPVRTTGPVRTARSVLGLLRDAVWVRLLVAVAVLSVAFILLGRWQYHRHEAKVDRNTLIDANYEAEAVPLTDVLADPSATLTPLRQWTPVRVSGVYEPAGTILIRNRPLKGEHGYEVVVPLRTSSGAALLVDRGWLPPGEDFARPGAVPAPPPGRVTVVARLRLGEKDTGETSPTRQERRIDPTRLADRIGGEVYVGAYALLASEQPAPPTAPTPLPPPDEGLGPHLAYAVQWWLGAVAAWVLLGVYAVREVNIRAGTPGQAPGSPVCAGPGPGRGPSRVVQALRARHRRRGPTDEEWEDAAVG